MARAVIEIAGDTTPLTRALGRIAPLVKRAAESIRGELAPAIGAATEAAQQAEAANHRAAKAMRAASRAAGKAATDEQRAQTRVAQQEANYRQNAARGEVAVVENVEAQKTRAVRRGADERVRALSRELEQRRRNAGAYGERAASGAMSFGSTAIGMTRTAQGSAAAIESRINDSLIPAGVRDRGELAAAHAAILARARSSGIGSERIADALARAQEATSLLSGGTAAERSANLSGALDDADFAANSRQDLSQVLMMRGVLSSQGIRGPEARAAMLAMTGIARAGSVELGNVVKEGRGPLMQNIAFAQGRLARNATSEDRVNAVRTAMVRTLATSEVAAAGGLSVRDSMNALAKLDRFTTNDRGVGVLRDRVMAQGGRGRAMANEMFEQSRNNAGQRVYRLRGGYRDSLNLASSLIGLNNGDASATANMLSAGGPTRPMVVDAQTRRLLLGLASQTANGESVSDRVRRMSSEGANYTATDLAAEGAIRAGEQTTRLVTNEETQRAALSDNTSSLNRLTVTLDREAAKHPLLAAAATAGGAAAVPTLARAAATALAGGGAATMSGARVAARTVARTGGMMGFLTSLLTPGNEDQGYFDDAAAIRAARGGATPQQAQAAGQRNNLQELSRGMQAAVAAGIREGMASASVSVPPAAQQHATTQANLAQGARPTTGR